MDIDLLKKWLIDLEAEKLKINSKISHIKALISGDTISSEPMANISVPIVTKTISGKINKSNEIYNACKNMSNNFTANDIKTYLERSENEEMRDIKLVYISGQLCKLADRNKINLLERHKGKGGGNIYSMSKKMTE